MANTTKISEAGRGTVLRWSRVEHAGSYIVGHIQDSAGLYCAPKVYKVYANEHGGEFVIIDGKRVYITQNKF